MSKTNPLALADKLSQILNRCAYLRLVAEKTSSTADAGKISSRISSVEKRINTLLKKAATQNLQMKPSIEKSMVESIKKLDSGIRSLEKTRNTTAKITIAAEHLDELLKLAAKIAK